MTKRFHPAPVPPEGDTAHCPLEAVHVRIEDSHRLWHQADTSYFDPVGFRANVNACIEALRSVTFVLQKYKRHMPGFESWYGRWQETLKSEPIMRWLVEARNRVVKEGDLQSLSTARISVVASYDAPPTLSLHVNPSASTEVIASSVDLSSIPEHLGREGHLRVERRWIALDLPSVEILEALRRAYGILGALLLDAHALIGLATLDRNVGHPAHARSGEIDPLATIPSCMEAHPYDRTIWVRLSTGVVGNPPEFPVVSDAAAGGKALERYGPPKLWAVEPGRTMTLREEAEVCLEQAKHILSTDGYHSTIAIIRRGLRVVGIVKVEAENRAEKYLLWHKMATQVKQTGADRIMVISEVWIGPFEPKPPGRQAAESPVREEALQLTVSTAAGEEFNLVALFHRQGDSIVFEPTRFETETLTGFLAPVRRVWGLEGPEEQAL